MKIVSNSMIKPRLGFIMLIITSVLFTNQAFSQLDTEHYFAPMHATSVGGFIPLPGDGGNQFLYLSTPSTTPFTVTVTDGSGAVITTATISNTSPFEYNVGTGQSTTTKMFVDQSQLNTPLSGRGLIITGPKAFTATFKTAMSAHAEMMTSKGKAAKGKTFRGGSIPLGTSGTDKGFFTSFMATEPGTTTITVNGYDPAVEFDGSTVVTADALTITLQQGESYVLSGTSATAANQSGFLGALISSDKDIIVENGAILGNIASGAVGQDAYFDQSAPVEKLGKDYIVINGGGDVTMELPVVIAHTDNTQIFTNGSSTPIATLNAGDFFVVPNSNYTNGNMYIRTTEPAYVYQAMSGGAQTNGGMMFVPPFNCYLPKQINIPMSDKIGTNSYTATAMVFTQQGSVVTLNGTVQSGGTLVPGTEWGTYKFAISGNAEIISTGAMSASLYGAAGTASYAGTYAGFSSIPSPSKIVYTDTCFQATTSFSSIHDIDSTITGFIWDFGNPSTGADNASTDEFPTHVFSATGTYNVQLIITRNTCNDTVIQPLTIISSMPASISEDATVCINAPEPILTLEASNGIPPYTFTYHINNGSDQQITTTSGNSVTLNAPTNTTGIYTYYLTGIEDSTGPGICSVVSDSATITVSSNLLISVNTDSLCYGESATLTASGADTYTWSPAIELDQTVGETVVCTPTQNRTYTVTGTSGTCTGSTETTVVINPTPSSNAGADVSICSGDTVAIGAPPAEPGLIYSWLPTSNLSGSTDPNPTVTLTNYTSAPIDVQYIVQTSPAGCFSFDTVIVTVNPSLDPTFSYGSATFCQAGSGSNPLPTITTSGGSFTSIPAGLVLDGTTGEVNLATSTLNTYTVTYTHNGSCPSSSSNTITITNLPDATFSYGSYCKDETTNPSPIFPAGSSAGYFDSSTGLTFMDTGTGEINLSTSFAGTYTVTNTIAAGGGCPSAVASNTITITAMPIIVVDSQIVCQGETATLVASGATTYTWNNGTIGDSLTDTPTITTLYSVIGTNNGCSSTKTAKIIVTPLPVVTLLNDTICIGDTVNLMASGASDYLWATGENYNPIEVLPSVTTTYTVTGTKNECSTNATATITVDSLPTITVNEPTVCEGNVATLTASGGGSYIWSDTTFVNPHTNTPASTKTYTVYGSTANCGNTAPTTANEYASFFNCFQTGCINTAITTVTVSLKPTISVNPNSICLGGSSTLSASGASTYTWAPGGEIGNSITVSPTQTTTYTVSDNTPGCSDTVMATLIVGQPPALIVNSSIICEGESATLSASGANSYNWSNGSTQNNITVSPTSNTTYTVTGNPENCPASTVVSVIVKPLPVITSTSDSTCAGGNATLTANGGVAYQWSDGSNLNYLNAAPNTTTNYMVTGYDSTGCGNTAIGTITVFPTPIANFDFSPNPIGKIDPTVYFTDRSTRDVVSWQWNFNDNDSIPETEQHPVHLYPNTENSYLVTLLVSNSGGCIDTVSKIVVVGPEFTIYVPNAFTPNNDGKNDYFEVFGEGITEFSMVIFDRWGNLVFETDDITDRWNGEHKNGSKPVQQDVYVWKINLKNVVNKEKAFEYMGTVSILIGNEK